MRKLICLETEEHWLIVTILNLAQLILGFSFFFYFIFFVLAVLRFKSRTLVELTKVKYTSSGDTLRNLFGINNERQDYKISIVCVCVGGG
jgi:hypothetical protein